MTAPRSDVSAQPAASAMASSPPTPTEQPGAHDAPRGDTIPRRQENGQPGPDAGDADTATPRLPHERDESADSQTKSPDHEVIEQARRDVESGQQDTGRGPVTDRLYERTLRDEAGEPGSPGKG